MTNNNIIEKMIYLSKSRICGRKKMSGGIPEKDATWELVDKWVREKGYDPEKTLCTIMGLDKSYPYLMLTLSYDRTVKGKHWGDCGWTIDPYTSKDLWLKEMSLKPAQYICRRFLTLKGGLLVEQPSPNTEGEIPHPKDIIPYSYMKHTAFDTIYG